MKPFVYFFLVLNVTALHQIHAQNQHFTGHYEGAVKTSAGWVSDSTRVMFLDLYADSTYVYHYSGQQNCDYGVMKDCKGLWFAKGNLIFFSPSDTGRELPSFQTETVFKRRELKFLKKKYTDFYCANGMMKCTRVKEYENQFRIYLDSFKCFGEWQNAEWYFWKIN